MAVGLTCSTARTTREGELMVLDYREVLLKLDKEIQSSHNLGMSVGDEKIRRLYLLLDWQNVEWNDRQQSMF